MKKGLVTFVLASTLVGLTGCADNGTKNNLRNDMNNNALDVRNVRNDNNNRLNVNNVNTHNLRYSNRAGRAVEKLQEVDLAHVIIRNNDAYVAVRLKNNRFQTGTGTTNNRNNTTGTRGTTGITGTNNNLGTTGTNGRDNHLTARGAGTGLNGNYPSTTGVNALDNTGTGLNPGAGGASNTRGTIGIRGTNNNNNTGTMNNNNTTFTGTNDGTAGTNDGTTGTNYRSVSSPLDQRIADQVRTADKGVHRVYISYDRDFFRQMTNYSTDLNTKGRNKNNNNLWNDFNNTVKNIFR
ncbi:hypothetical protein L1999_12220 [Neobacillus drentensis]|uniref:YhcN/YlaJ family sporulation lipoprotein n=1 Tax=Neobacillus drentensis TaxID=220684 RepID=UPI001F272389|nr:YhcN/YlaJ family sporulation lipoprotein [Neobacillus drentensis]ULT59239.1 hypothetical protein L1999_12220 [Neobacillus drentensis]